MGNKTTQKGFSLIELLVAMMAFSVIMIVVTYSYSGALTIQRRAYSLQKVEENVTFVLEAVAKEIRVSKVISGNVDCSSTQTFIIAPFQIRNPDGKVVSYVFDPVNQQVLRMIEGDNNTWRPMNSNYVKFTQFKFCVTGADLTDVYRQPRITIIAGVKGSESAYSAEIPIQLTISQRYLAHSQ